MSVAPPRQAIPRSPSPWNPAADPASWEWGRVPAFPRFVLADGSGPAVQQTRLRVCWDDEALYVRFDCEDRDAWGTYGRRDDPIYEEEAVEVFLAPGAEDPTRYFEFEVSPLGTVFDARIHNPTSRRIDMTGDPSWDCPGLRWAAGRLEERQDWWAVLAIPWAGLLPAGDRPAVWRANFYRIERPRTGATGAAGATGAVTEPEFSGWSPTLTRPADFHKPARFGVIELADRSSTR